MLLALSIFLTHPAPHRDMLLPFLHPNLAQIARTHVAMTILTGRRVVPNATSTHAITITPTFNVNDKPASLITWPCHTLHSSEARDIICRLPQIDLPYNLELVTNSTSDNNFTQTSKQLKGRSSPRPSRRPRLKTLGDCLHPKKTNFLNSMNPPVSTIKPQHTISARSTKKKRPIKNVIKGLTPPLTGIQKITAYFKPSQHVDSNSPHIRNHSTLSNKTSSTSPVQVVVTPNTTCRVKKRKGGKPSGLTNHSTRPPIMKCNPQLRITQFLSDNTYSCPTSTTWGHQLESIDSSDTLRIILQNPNGIKLNPLDMGEFEHILNICHTMGAGIISLSESNVNWNHTYLLGRVHQAVRKVWQTTAIQHSQHPEPYHQQCQRGGTLQIATDRWVSRLQSKGQDPYGLGHGSHI
jgi:hypothetical protein